MPRGLRARLIAAFVLAVACFVGSTLYAVHRARRIDDRARAIATELMPSIERLAETRNLLRALEAAEARYQVRHDDEVRRLALRTMAEVEDSFARHLSFPASHAGEQARWAEIEHALAKVARAVDRALAGADGGSEEEVHASVEAAAGAIRRTIDLDIDHARELALTIEDERRDSTRVALLLDLASALFTLIAGTLALRALAHQQRVVDDRNALLARRADELEQFAGRVAHDIVGPLSVTRLSIESAGVKLGEPAAPYVERAKRGVDRVTVIVDGLLRFARAGARPDAGVVAGIDAVVRDVTQALEPVAAQADVRLEVDAGAPCKVAAHAGVLASVVENLVGNAIKYMHGAAERRVAVRVIARPTTARLEVSDTGPGIDPAILGTVFDPHVRGRDRSQPGLGLGLATVRRVAEAHGGGCGVSSRLGEGSLFWVELPLADAPGEPAPADARVGARAT